MKQWRPLWMDLSISLIAFELFCKCFWSMVSWTYDWKVRLHRLASLYINSSVLCVPCWPFSAFHFSTGSYKPFNNNHTLFQSLLHDFFIKKRFRSTHFNVVGTIDKIVDQRSFATTNIALHCNGVLCFGATREWNFVIVITFCKHTAKTQMIKNPIPKLKRWVNTNIQELTFKRFNQKHFTKEKALNKKGR